MLEKNIEALVYLGDTGSMFSLNNWMFYGLNTGAVGSLLMISLITLILSDSTAPKSNAYVILSNVYNIAMFSSIHECWSHKSLSVYIINLPK